MNTNYVDSRTSEEKEADSKIETTVTTASAMTNTEKILAELKTLRTLNGSEAEAILEDGTSLSEWIATSINQAIAEERARVRGIIQKERDTWAKESIGDKALQSLEKALQEKNIYFCEKCKKQSICDKPTVYKNCPCGADFSSLDKPLTDKE